MPFSCRFPADFIQVADRKEHVRNLQETSMKTTSKRHENNITKDSTNYEQITRKTFFRDVFGDVVLMSFSCRFLTGSWHVLFLMEVWWGFQFFFKTIRKLKPASNLHQMFPPYQKLKDQITPHVKPSDCDEKKVMTWDGGSRWWSDGEEIGR